MAQADFKITSLDELVAFFYQANLHKIQNHIFHLTSQQITLAMTVLQEKECPKAEAKLIAAFKGLTDNLQLEALGRGLSSTQFVTIIDFISKQNMLTDKLSALLVGLSPQAFFQSLTQLSNDHIYVLKHESNLEPLQHQLNLFIHECDLMNRQQLKNLKDLYDTLEQIQPETLSQSDLLAIQKRIELIGSYYRNSLNAINQILSIAWNTNRLDLIEKLNQLKEATSNQYAHLIGFSRSEESPPTGIFAILERRFSRIFGSSEEGQEDIEALHDDESAIEGLAKLSIWYLKDYWEIGLIPSIYKKEELELDPSQHSKKECLAHREKLFNLVQHNLYQLGLYTVKDLKKAQIFSKKMLIDYIKRHKEVLELR